MKSFGIAVTLLAGLFLTSCTVRKAKNGLENENLFGKVRSVAKTVYKATENNGDITKGECDGKYIDKYNDIGNLDSEIIYWPDGNLNGIFVYSYNNKGQEIEMTSRNRDDSLEFKTVSKYDSVGNKTEEIMLEQGGALIRKSTFKYNKRGFKVEENVFLKNDSSTREITYENDVNGILVGCTTRSNPGNEILKFKNKYDKKENLVECDAFNNRDSLLYRITYRFYDFDKVGNWLKQTWYMDNKIVESTEREIEYYKN